MLNLWPKNPHFGKFGGKIEILSTLVSFVGNLQLFVRKLKLSVWSTFLTQNAAVWHYVVVTVPTRICAQ